MKYEMCEKFYLYIYLHNIIEFKYTITITSSISSRPSLPLRLFLAYRCDFLWRFSSRSSRHMLHRYEAKLLHPVILTWSKLSHSTMCNLKHVVLIFRREKEEISRPHCALTDVLRIFTSTYKFLQYSLI